MADFPKLKSKTIIKGKIILRTGLHIGASDVGLAIGGADKVVVRNPQDGRPCIPGSSLKGKLRSLLEKAGFTAAGIAGKPPLPVEPRVDSRGNSYFEVKPCQCGRRDCPVCQIFGVSAADKGGTEAGENGTLAKWSGVGRLRVRDGILSDESARAMKEWRYLDMPFTEVKTEVSIDRLTSRANPRNFERVPAGARFDLELVLDCFEGDDFKRFLETIRTGLELLEHDYLGGQGTRGYGAVRVVVESVETLAVDRRSSGGAMEKEADDQAGLKVRFPPPEPEKDK